MTTQLDLLFELGTEELPPKSLKLLSENLGESFSQAFSLAQLNFESIQVFATPRRLGVYIFQLDIHQKEQWVERRGPTFSAAYNAEGEPTKALIGFARSCKADINDLIEINNEQGIWMGFKTLNPGSPTIKLLPQIAEQALHKLPIAKKMRWGTNDYQFIRPVHWIVFLFGDQVVETDLFGIKSSRFTRGHRFHFPERIELNSANDYVPSLEGKGYVIPDFAKRSQRIAEQIKKTAAELGYVVDTDDELLNEITALTEWPVAISGSFEKRFLQVPAEALVLTMKQNQKYFPLYDEDGKLANHFITIANIESPCPELIKAGNERVIRPRLTDAMFFWEQDGKYKLALRIEKLHQVTFQKDLGSMYDKTRRVEQLALWLAKDLDVDEGLVSRAAWLSRCDLMTQMVYEFPEMQGYMGKYQALRDGEDAAVAQALVEFYLPRHSGDHLPASHIGQCLCLAERMDTISGIFSIGLKPTGEKDPYGLRRSCIGIIRILLETQPDIDFNDFIKKSISLQPAVSSIEELFAEIKSYFMERVKGIFLDSGYSSQIVSAVLETNPSSLGEIGAKATAVKSFTHLEQTSELIELNKRIYNITKKNKIANEVKPSLEYCVDLSESRLLNKIDEIKIQILALAENQNYTSVLKLLMELKNPVADFFDSVMVLDEDMNLRQNRLSMLKEIRELFLLSADFSCL
jgi:glycyl-tRNA synthetase beta chain